MIKFLFQQMSAQLCVCSLGTGQLAGFLRVNRGISQVLWWVSCCLPILNCNDTAWHSGTVKQAYFALGHRDEFEAWLGKSAGIRSSGDERPGSYKDRQTKTGVSRTLTADLWTPPQTWNMFPYSSVRFCFCQYLVTSQKCNLIC